MGFFGHNKVNDENQILKQIVDKKEKEVEQLTSELAVANAKLKVSNEPLRKLREENMQLLSDIENMQTSATKYKSWDFFESATGSYNYVYVLRLVDGYYYVGHTTNLKDRLISHFNGINGYGFEAAIWTQVHQPIALVELTEFEKTVKISELRKSETQRTLELMHNFGYQKVRGGIFVKQENSAIEKQLLDDSLQRRWHFQVSELGLKKENIATSEVANTVTKRSQPTVTHTHLKRFLDNGDLSQKQFDKIVDTQNQYMYAVVVMTNHGTDFVFSRQFQNLDYVLKRIAEDKFNISGYKGKSSDFGIIQELIMYTHEKCPDSLTAKKRVKERCQQLIANKRRVFSEIN